MKKYLFSLVLLLMLFLNINNVLADYCTDCANKGTPCGKCGRSCAIVDGECRVSDYYQEFVPKSCNDYDETTCENNDDFACIWNEKYGYCNTDELLYVSCGDAFDIPLNVPKMTKTAVNILKIATPIILIITSIITLLKALAASKDDEIKKAQQSLIKKIIIAAVVFFVITIVQFVISIAADTAEKDNVTKCLNCFLTGDCTENIYYKTNIGGVNYCTYVAGDNGDKKTEICEDSK